MLWGGMSLGLYAATVGYFAVVVTEKYNNQVGVYVLVLGIVFVEVDVFAVCDEIVMLMLCSCRCSSTSVFLCLSKHNKHSLNAVQRAGCTSWMQRKGMSAFVTFDIPFCRIPTTSFGLFPAGMHMFCLLTSP